ncbi:MAG: DUF4129 domain-containing protein [Pseudomonadota bacterium]
MRGTKAVIVASVFAVLTPCGLSQTPDEATPQSQFDTTEETSASDGIDTERFETAYAAFQARRDLQTERPEWSPEARPPPNRQTNSGNGFFRAIANFFEWIGPALGYGLIAILVIGLATVLYMVFGEAWGIRRREKSAKTEPDLSLAGDLRPDQAEARALLEDADALARAGRYAEAVHLLLYRSINDIQEKKGEVVPRSLTAREIGRLANLPIAIRSALMPIIRLVERSFFGGRPVDADGWQEARQSYERFAFGGGWT